MEDESDAVRGRMSGLMAGCPGRAGCLGLGSVDEHRVERSYPGQNSEDFVDGNWGKDGEKLDLPATHEIRASNPTKLHHTNNSQKKIGAIFVGQFSNLGQNQQNKARKHNGEAPKS